MNIGAAFTLIRNGASIKQTDSAGGIPITRIETIANRVIDRNHMGYADIYNGDKYSSYFLRDGDILMSHINSIQHLGKAAIYHPLDEKEKIIHGMNLLVLRANQKILDNQFAYFYFSSDSFLHKLPRITKKSVNQASFTVSELKKIDIPCPALSQQHKIAKILSIIQTLCNKRNEQLKIFDELVKSRFLEMFGMSEGIDKHLEDVADICSGITKGRKVLGLELREVPYMAVSNVKMGYIDLSTVKTIMATENEIEQYRLFPNDILMTEGGDPDKVGRGAIIRNLPKDCIHQNHIFRVRLHKDVLLPEFFEEYLQGNSARRYFLKAAKQTTGIASINMKQLRALPVKIPPIKVQIQYSDFVHQVDKSKMAVQKSLDELEILKKSLMQTYFG